MNGHKTNERWPNYWILKATAPLLSASSSPFPKLLSWFAKWQKLKDMGDLQFFIPVPGIWDGSFLKKKAFLPNREWPMFPFFTIGQSQTFSCEKIWPLYQSKNKTLKL